MLFAIQLANLLNATIPGIAGIVTLVRRKDGTISILALLDEADAAFDKNIAQINEWKAAHPKPPTA